MNEAQTERVIKAQAKIIVIIMEIANVKFKHFIGRFYFLWTNKWSEQTSFSEYGLARLFAKIDVNAEIWMSMAF